MPRHLRNTKPLIYIFCEGESEQAYARFLKKQFSDVAIIKIPAAPGLFDTAQAKFRKDPQYKNNAEITDEVWFFFDVEISDAEKWDARYKIIKQLRHLKKKPGIRVRLLMTTACIEYWLVLHYQMTAPALATVADKERMRHNLEKFVPGYIKGDPTTTWQIAEKYHTAIENGQHSIHNLENSGLPTLEDTDERNRWLLQCGKTFTTVQEAIQYLEELNSSSANDK